MEREELREALRRKVQELKRQSFLEELKEKDGADYHKGRAVPS